MPFVGQRVVYRVASSDYRSARVTEVVSGSTVNLVAFSTGDAWGDGDPGSQAGKVYGSISQGTAVGTWQEAAGVDPAVASAIADAVATAAPGFSSAAGAGSPVSLALNTARQPHATRPVRVTVYGTWSWSLTAIGSQSGTAALQSDSSATPSTQRGLTSATRALGVGISINDSGSMPWSMTYDVPAAHYYQIATAGTGTFAIGHINETVL